MAYPSEISTIDKVSDGDFFIIHSTGNGELRRASTATVTNYLNGGSAESSETIQREFPAATGFAIAVQTSLKHIWLLIRGQGNYLSGTITLPQMASCFDQQEILVTSQFDIGVDASATNILTINGNGAAINGAPFHLLNPVLPNTKGFSLSFRLRLDLAAATWWTISQ